MPRRPYSENFPPRSSYRPQKRRKDLPSRHPRDPPIAALNQESYAELIALVARNNETNPTAVPVTTRKTQTQSFQPRKCAEDIQEQINELGWKLDTRINGIARSIRPRQEANEKYRDHCLSAKSVCYRCGRPGHIQCSCNRIYQSDETQVYHTTEPTFRQSVRTYTLED